MKRILFYIIPLLILLSFSGCTEEPVKTDYECRLIDRMEIRVTDVGYTTAALEIYIPKEALDKLDRYTYKISGDIVHPTTNLNTLKFEQVDNTSSMYKASIYQSNSLQASKRYKCIVRIEDNFRWNYNAFGLQYPDQYEEYSIDQAVDFTTLSIPDILSSMQLVMRDMKSSGGGVIFELYVPEEVILFLDKYSYIIQEAVLFQQSSYTTILETTNLNQLTFSKATDKERMYKYVLYKSDSIDTENLGMGCIIAPSDKSDYTVLKAGSLNSKNMPENILDNISISVEHTISWPPYKAYVNLIIPGVALYFQAQIIIERVRLWRNGEPGQIGVSEANLTNFQFNYLPSKNMYSCPLHTFYSLPYNWGYSVEVYIRNKVWTKSIMLTDRW